jgi:hypothetical protein
MVVIVDIVADGRIYGVHSMISFGAVIVDKEGKLDKTFYGKCKPVGTKYDPEALAVSGHTREETLLFDDPKKVMEEFALWLKSNQKDPKDLPIFYSDKNGYDFGWINYYFLFFTGNNPFEHS